MYDKLAIRIQAGLPRSLHLTCCSLLRCSLHRRVVLASSRVWHTRIDRTCHG